MNELETLSRQDAHREVSVFVGMIVCPFFLLVLWCVIMSEQKPCAIEEVKQMEAENARLKRQLEQIRPWLHDYHRYLRWDRDITTARRVQSFLLGGV